MFISVVDQGLLMKIFDLSADVPIAGSCAITAPIFGHFLHLFISQGNREKTINKLSNTFRNISIHPFHNHPIKLFDLIILTIQSSLIVSVCFTPINTLQ